MVARSLLGGQKQQLEIADSRGELLKKHTETILKKRRFRNALESDLMKHSSNLRGSGVDFEPHFEGYFDTEIAREAIPEARF